MTGGFQRTAPEWRSHRANPHTPGERLWRAPAVQLHIRALNWTWPAPPRHPALRPPGPGWGRRRPHQFRREGSQPVVQLHIRALNWTWAALRRTVHVCTSDRFGYRSGDWPAGRDGPERAIAYAVADGAGRLECALPPHRGPRSRRLVRMPGAPGGSALVRDTPVGHRASPVCNWTFACAIAQPPNGDPRRRVVGPTRWGGQVGGEAMPRVAVRIAPVRCRCAIARPGVQLHLSRPRRRGGGAPGGGS